MKEVNKDVNARIKEVRLKEGLSQRAFGDRIGISGASVAQIELFTNNPSEQTIRAICQEFKIRRKWLETGSKPISRSNEDDEVVDDVLAGEDEFIKAVIRGIAKTPGGWEKMKEVFDSIKAELDKQKEPEE